VKLLAVIPARGGSKGVPRKNIKLLNGQPLIHYSIKAAMEVLPKEQIVVSTEDEEIKSVAEQCGIEIPFLRPAAIAQDFSTTRDVLLHAIHYYEQQGYFADTLILLQPTSPLREAYHIKEALEMYNDSLDMVVSVKETKSNPYYVLFEENEEGYLRKSKSGKFTRRQDCPKVWEYNGAVYIINIQSLKQKEIVDFEKILPYEMSEQDSVDIDTPFDFELAELLLQKKLK
jgi:CMP-N,N'-diacetyllegionaminic acid synthase